MSSDTQDQFSPFAHVKADVTVSVELLLLQLQTERLYNEAAAQMFNSPCCISAQMYIFKIAASTN